MNYSVIILTFSIIIFLDYRSFGVHMSKVRSVTLDAWEPELIKVMQGLGNNVVNRIYEAEVDESVAPRATPHCNRYLCFEKLSIFD